MLFAKYHVVHNVIHYIRYKSYNLSYIRCMPCNIPCIAYLYHVYNIKCIQQLCIQHKMYKVYTTYKVYAMYEVYTKIGRFIYQKCMELNSK